MNFYPHHIGDYLTATAHLSWLEDCAYRRLLDVYYSREQAIPAEIPKACRLVRASSKDERAAVDTVLNEFFRLTDAGWIHSRCEVEIVKAREAAERARVNGKKGGRPPKSKPAGNPEETQPVIPGNPEKSDSQAPNPNPITKPNHSVPDGTDGGSPAAAPAAPSPAAAPTPTPPPPPPPAPPTKTPEEMAKAELWRAAVSVLEQGGCPPSQCRTFMGKLVQDYTFPVVQQAVAAAVTAQPADAREYLKATCQRQSGQRLAPNKQEALEARGQAVVDAWASKGETHAAA
ncbi:DUF1376 domain-containing protein [Xylophilus rhododendri]|uniref:DUF1376 domain-containing protein n=1 Tax=Xylophilus rhododendri TaxID=2697032 RepID=A0A857JA49_9BURK|nr:YdaU family protein [Xylophilus rhododendri]QHJ00094.1 DUF1376 domain-containing protein [Xylophilus rhododendri]